MRDSREQSPEDLEDQREQVESPELGESPGEGEGQEQEQEQGENQDPEDAPPEKGKKKKKHPYELDYEKLPKGKLGRIIFDYNDYDMIWERHDEENQEWLEDEKTHLGERVDAFFMLLVSITQKYRKEIQLEKTAKIKNDEEGNGGFRLWLNNHCHKFIAILIWIPLIVSIFIGYFVNLIAGVVIFTVCSLIPVIAFMSGCAFTLSHTYSDNIDFNYNMEIFASLRRMEREINKLLPEVNKYTFEPIGYKWELAPNCRAFILCKNFEYEPEDDLIVPDMQEGGAQWADASGGYDDGFRKSQEHPMETQKSEPLVTGGK